MLKQTPKTRVLFVRRLTPVLLVVFGVFYVSLTLFRAPSTVYAAASNTVNFQARLQTGAGAIVPDGTYNVEFKLYDASISSGSSRGSCSNDSSCLWVETRMGGNAVEVRNGYLSVSLGDVTAFGSNIDWTQNLWLTMNIGGTGSPSWDGEMNPRLPLTAVPYAFTAGQLQTTNDGNTSKLSIQAPTGGNQSFVIQDQGADGTYDLLTQNEADSNYIQLNGATQNGDIHISGASSSDSVETNAIDTSGFGPLVIGGDNASTISIGNAGGDTATTINGSTVVKSASGDDSQTAFQVQGSSGGTSVFDVDTINNRVGLNTNTPGRELDVAANDSGTTNSSSMVRLMQGGAGDTTMELANNDASYFVGIDTSAGNLFTISSSEASNPSDSSDYNTFSSSLFSLSTTGAAAFQNSVDSTSAFQVNNAAGTASVLDVDTTNTRVGIGTNVPTRTFDVSVSNGATTAPPILIEQHGTGDSDIELKTPTQSFYVGVDSSDNSTFKVSSTAANGTSSTMGLATQGTNADNGSGGYVVCQPIVSTLTGNITGVSMDYAAPLDTVNNKFRMALYADNSGQPAATPLAQSGEGTITAGWNSIGLSANVTVGNTYWLCAQSNTTDRTKNNPYYNAGAPRRSVYISQTYPSWPTTGWNTGATAVTFSMYATIEPASAGDSFATSIFSLTNTGAATFRNSANSNAAFQVQNATGDSIFSINTNSRVITVGSVGGSTTGTILVLGNRTTSGDPSEVDGAMYYNSNMGTFRCGQDTIWVSCLGGLLTSTTQINSTVTATASETPLGTTYTLPANYCTNGRTLRLTMYGAYQSATGATLTVRTKIGTNAVSTSYAGDSFAQHNQDSGWSYTGVIICPNTAGSGATVSAQGLMTFGGDVNRSIPYTITNTVNTGVSNSLSITVQWSSNSAANIFTLRTFLLESLGP